MIRFAKTFLLGGAAYLASAGAASADPVSIGSFIISSFLSAGLGSILPTVSAAVIGQVVIGAAVVGASILSSVLAPKPSIQQQEFKNTFETGESSEIRAVGKVRVGGLKVYGNTNRKDRFRLIAHTKGLWTATEEHYLGGREVTVNEDGRVSTPPWVTSNSSWIKIKSKAGDGTETAWPELIEKFPSLWTADHRVRGIHQSLLHYVTPGVGPTNVEKHLKLYQTGEPAYEKVGRAEPVHDPRDGAQSAADAGTWTWDDNGPLCAAHILRSYPSMRVDDFDYADIGLEATKAEALVATRTGTAERSRASGFWPAENPRGEVMDQVLRSIGAEIVPTDDAKYSIRLIDDVRTPQITFSERHVVEVEMAYGPEGVQRPNVCRVKYYSPERNYEMTEIDLAGIAWARIDDEIERYGEQIQDIELPFCFDAAQAQRIARRMFALSRADAGIARMNFAGVAAWGMTVASLPFPDIGPDGATVWKTCAIGVPRIDDEAGQAELPFVVWPVLTPWNPAEDEALPPPPIPELLYESELHTPIAPSAALVVEYPGGGREVRLAIAPTWFDEEAGSNDEIDNADLAEANIRTYTAGQPDAWQSMNEPSLTLAYRDGDFFGRQADFRVRYFDDDDNGSYLSPLLSVPMLAIDNTPCGAPAASVVPQTTGPDVGPVFKATPSELRATYLTFEQREPAGGGAFVWTLRATFDIRPGVEVSYAMPYQTPSTFDATVTVRATTYTTGDVAGTPAVIEALIPGTGI